MTLTSPEVQGVGIVVNGNLNPAILHPLWFSQHNLIRPEEAASAKIQVISQQVAIFEADWFHLQALEESLNLRTSDPSKWYPLRDLAAGVFRLLEHTPISSFGFTHECHFKIANEERWHAIGHALAPKAVWNKIVEKPGLQTLSISGTRENSSASKVIMTVEPSRKHHPGVYIRVHEQFSTKDDREAVSIFQKALEKSWDSFLAFCRTVHDPILSIE